MRPVILADSLCRNSKNGVKGEIPVGGPKTYSHKEMAELAFSILGKTKKITRIPMWMVNLVVIMIRPFSKHYYTLAAFFTAIMQNDFDAPKAGTHLLKEYYEEFSSQL